MEVYKLMQELYLVCHGHQYYYMEPADAQCLRADASFNMTHMTVVDKYDLKEHVSCFDEFQNIVPNGKILADYI